MDTISNMHINLQWIVNHKIFYLPASAKAEAGAKYIFPVKIKNRLTLSFITHKKSRLYTLLFPVSF